MASTIYTPSTMSSSDVKKMQKALVDAGYSVGSSGVDGIWGKDTAAALSAYKAATGGSNTYGNSVGNETFNKLYRISSRNSNGSQVSADNETETTIQSALTPIQNMYKNMQTQQNAALQQAQQASEDQINNVYDMAARNYYQFYKTQKAKLPENLSKVGVTGGASESAQLKLMNDYSENLYKNESARNSQLESVNQNYNDKIAENSINTANKMANAYLQLAQQQLSYEREDKQAQQEAQAQAEIANWNANVQANMQKQLAKGDTIWTWTDDDGKIHWTTYESKGLAMGGKKLSPSSSKVTTSSKKSSGSKVKYSGGSGVSGNDNNKNNNKNIPSRNNYNLIKNVALGNMYGNSTYGMRVGGREDALNYIKRSLSGVNINGQVHKLTESQAVKLLKELGLN